MYTHFGKGFYEHGCLEPRFERVMRRLGAMNGWFVPAATLLDFLAERRGPHELRGSERTRLEWRWFFDQAAGRARR
jgi:hypothetical protein